MKKIKITLSILLSVITFLCSHGQTGGGIFEGDVTLTSQAEVDAFPYTEVTGILTISGNSIGNLDGLSELTLVGGLTISGNANLTNVDGLSALSQVCEGNVVLTSQAEVDAFSCAEVIGDLTISGSDITDLRNLSVLTKVSGGLNIVDNPNLESLDGLSGLATVGEIVRIQSNHVLSNIDALNSLKSVGGLFISSNPALLDIGLSSFQSLENGGRLYINSNENLHAISGFNKVTVAGPIEISNNPKLGSISGFHSLLSMAPLEVYPTSILIYQNDVLTNLDCFTALAIVGGIRISMNNQLTALDGFLSVAKLYGTLEISSNELLKSVNGFQGLTHIFSITREITDVGIVITNNPSLESFTGLSSLKEIYSQYFNRVDISNNPSLRNIDGLSSLASIVADHTLSFQIKNNATLENIDGLSALIEVGAILPNLNFTITENPLLTQCCVLRPLLARMDQFYHLDTLIANGNLLISENGGCTVDDIMSCGPQSCQGDVVLTTQAQVDAFSCTEVTGSLTISGNDITNLNALSGLTRVGSLIIKGNASLSNVNGLSALTTAGSETFLFISDIEISDNPVLTNLDGLSSLEVANNCPISINNNASLETINGFSPLSFINEALRITNNPQLKSINGFSGLISMGSFFETDLIIDNNASLTNLDGLSSLRSIGGKGASVQIINNGSLLNIDGLRSLISIRGSATLLNISNNDALKNLNGLSSFIDLGTDQFGELIIEGNAMLENIDGLSQIRTPFREFLPFSRITIVKNPSLSQCNGLYPLLVSMGWEVVIKHISLGNIKIVDNGAGCTIEDILANNPQTISIFSVINIRTGNAMNSFVMDTVTLDLIDPNFSDLGIQAHTFPTTVGSVEFRLNEIRHTENNLPYVFDLPRLDPGTYNIETDVYSQSNRQGVKGVGKIATIIVKNSAAVESYELVDATGRPIKPLNEGDKINIKEVVFSKSVHIRANVSDNNITSVRFFLNGVFVRREMSAPFAFNGNNDEAYYPWKPAPGDYTILAIPYVIRNNKEYEGKSLEIHFTVEAQESPIAVESFDVVDTFGNILKQLNDGDQINIQDPMFKAINIVANTSGQVGSVNFWVNNRSYRTENGVPYTLAGDQNGKFNAWSPGVGDYKLTAIPHSESNAKGTVGKSLTVQIKVVNENAATATRLVTNTALNEEPLFQEGLVGVSLYPVPVGHELNVKIDDTAAGKDAMLTIVNFQGLTLYKNSYAKSQTINTLELKPGVYMLQIVNNSGFRRVVKFIKK